MEVDLLFFSKRLSFDEKYTNIILYKLSIKSEIPSDVNLFCIVKYKYFSDLLQIFTTSEILPLEMFLLVKRIHLACAPSCNAKCSEISIVREIAVRGKDNRCFETVMNNAFNAPSKLVNFHPNV